MSEIYVRFDNGFVKLFRSYSLDDLKQTVSQILNIPIYNISFRNSSGDYYNYFDFSIKRDLYVYVDSIINRLTTDIRDARNNYSDLSSKYNSLNSENSSLRSELSSVRSNYSTLESNYNSLSSKNRDNAYKISTLSQQNEQNQRQINNLNQQIQKEKEEKEKKEKNHLKFKESFENSQKTIEEKNVEESKKFIKKCISNKFVKEFEIEKPKESEFKKSLNSFMEIFTNEFMQYCLKFLQSFKVNSQQIIEQYKFYRIGSGRGRKKFFYK